MLSQVENYWCLSQKLTTALFEVRFEAGVLPQELPQGVNYYSTER